eukprot:418114-Prymnesium_polylepis.1
MCVALICHTAWKLCLVVVCDIASLASDLLNLAFFRHATGSGAGPRRVLHRPLDHLRRPGSRSQ